MVKHVKYFKLDNGMDVYALPDENTHLAGVGVKTGSFHDPPDANGLAHIVEHVIARGGPPKIKKNLERKLWALGCGPNKSINIHTNYYDTFYGTDLLHRRRHSLELFSIFADMIRMPLISKEGLEIELPAVYTEYLVNGTDLAYDLADNLLLETVYEKNPVRNRIDCRSEQLSSVTTYKIRKFFKEHYVPNNMFAILLGPSLDDTRKIVEKHFGNFEPKAVPALGYDNSDNFPKLGSRKIVESEKPGIASTHVMMGFPTMPFGYDGDEELEVMAQILSFRVHNVLRDGNRVLGKGTYHPEVNISRSSIHGILKIWFPTPSVDYAYEGIEKIIGVCEDIKKRGVCENELDLALKEVSSDKRKSTAKKLRKKYREELISDIDMAKNALRLDYLDSFESSIGRLTDLIIEGTCCGDPDMKFLNTYMTRLKGIGLNKIVKVAKEYLNTDAFAAAIVKPVPGTYQSRPINSSPNRFLK